MPFGVHPSVVVSVTGLNRAATSRAAAVSGQLVPANSDAGFASGSSRSDTQVRNNVDEADCVPVSNSERSDP
jgi:hypothetical protein